MRGRAGKAPSPVVDGILTGSAAGGAAALIACPADLIKCRLQAQGDLVAAQQRRREWVQRGEVGPRPPLYRGPLDAARQTWRHEGGARAFYNGLGATLVRDVAGCAIMFASYDAIRSACVAARPPRQVWRRLRRCRCSMSCSSALTSLAPPRQSRMNARPCSLAAGPPLTCAGNTPHIRFVGCRRRRRRPLSPRCVRAGRAAARRHRPLRVRGLLRGRHHVACCVRAAPRGCPGAVMGLAVCTLPPGRYSRAVFSVHAPK